MANLRNYKGHLLESLTDPTEAAAYINAAIEGRIMTFKSSLLALL
jgi:hypothetical protein